MVETLIGCLLFIAVGAVGAMVFFARQGRFSVRALWLLAIALTVGLGAMIVSDWPTESLSTFWAEHSILGSVLSALLVVGIGFFAFELRETQENDRLDHSLTLAGFSGVVDHVVDAEVALALATAIRSPEESGWPERASTTRPLRWLRQGRELRLGRNSGQQVDPRRVPPVAPIDYAELGWRLDLLNEVVRRLSSGIRDWAPVVGRSRAGLEVLVVLSYLRNETELLRYMWTTSAGSTEVPPRVMAARVLARVLAIYLERQNGLPEPRSEVLLTLQGLEPGSPDLARLKPLVSSRLIRDLTEITGMLTSVHAARPES